MHNKKIIHIQIIALLIYIIAVLCFFPDAEKNNRQHLNDCVSYNSGWIISDSMNSDTYVAYDSLPAFYPTNGGRDAWISKILPDVSDGDCIGFFSFQQQVEVYLDGTKVYSFLPYEHSKSSTPGNKWNFLPLCNEYSGQTLTVHIFQCYSNSQVSIPCFYYGTQSGITLSYLNKELPLLSLSIFMILVGIALFLFQLLYGQKANLEKSLLYLSFFAIFRGCWTGIEANTYSFFWTHLLLISQVSYLCLKIATVSFIHFLNISLHNGSNKVMHGLTIASIIDFWLSSYLQFFGIVDFANTVWMTHVILISSSSYACIDTLHTLCTCRKNPSLALSHNRKRAYLTQIGSTLLIIATSLIDLIRYYLFPSPDVARYCRIGDLIYVLSVSIALFMDFIYLVKVGHHAARIREEASLDPMTKLRNRASFEHDIAAVSKRFRKNYSIIMMDLNNLKIFNDAYGHDMGDYYIIISSEAIRDYFAPYGNAYRIGGDEFCIIAKGLKEEKFIELRTAIEEHMRSLHVPNHKELHMEVSTGYAEYNPSLDHDLRDTMKRADEQMYLKKKELKGRN